MRYINQKITVQLLKYNIINEREIPVYHYGLELILTTVFSTFSVLLLACYLDNFLLGLTYLLFSVPLRITAGGYHAPTYPKCLLISSSTYIILSYTSKFLHLNGISPFLWNTVLFLCAVYILLKAPVKNKQHPINEQKIKKNKLFAEFFLLMDCLCLMPSLYIYPNSYIVQFAILTIASVAVLIIPTQRKKVRYNVQFSAQNNS